MEAILKFNLPEETDLFEIYKNALNYQSFIHDFSIFLRNKSKYEDDVKAEEIKTHFYRILEENNIRL